MSQREIEAARTLVERYPAIVDAGDADAVAALFAKDASLVTASATYEGRDAVAEFYGPRLGGSKLHLVTDIQLSPSGDGEVAATSRFAAFIGSVDNPQLTWGTYEDTIVVNGDDAAFKVRRITIDSAGPALDVWGELLAGYRR